MTVIYNPFTGMLDIIRGNFNIGQSGMKDITGGDYTVLLSDSFLKVDGTLTINLYSAVGRGGRIIVIKNIGSGAVTLDPFGSQLIDEDLEKIIILRWTSISLISDNANWFIL